MDGVVVQMEHFQMVNIMDIVIRTAPDSPAMVMVCHLRHLMENEDQLGLEIVMIVVQTRDFLPDRRQLITKVMMGLENVQKDTDLDPETLTLELLQEVE